MIQRINLIEREPFRFTYEQLARASFIVLLICLFLFVVQTVIGQYNSKQIKNLTMNIENLKNQKEQLLRTQAPQMEEGPVLELKKRFDQTPHWSKFLNDLILRIPTNVWFTSLQSSAGVSNSVVFHGIARDASDLAEFLSRLNESPFLANIVLSTSKKEKLLEEEGALARSKEGDEEMGFTFSVECNTVVPRE